MQQCVGAADRGGGVTVGDEIGHPGPHAAGLDRREGCVLKGGKDETSDDRAVAGPGRGSQVDATGLNFGIPLAESDPGESRVGPLTSQLVGFHSGKEGLGVGLACEVSGPLPAVRCPVARLPGAGLRLADVCHATFLPSVSVCWFAAATLRTYHPCVTLAPAGRVGPGFEAASTRVGMASTLKFSCNPVIRVSNTLSSECQQTCQSVLFFSGRCRTDEVSPNPVDGVGWSGGVP